MTLNKSLKNLHKRTWVATNIPCMVKFNQQSVIFAVFNPLKTDSYLVFKTNIIVSGDVDYMLVATYLADHSPVYPDIEGRITLTTTTSSSAGILMPSSFVILILGLVFGS